MQKYINARVRLVLYKVTEILFSIRIYADTFPDITHEHMPLVVT